MKKFLLFTLLFASLFLSGCSINTDDPFSSVPVERDIKNSDITWLQHSEGVSSVTLNFKCNVKVKEVTIQVTFLDKNDNVVVTNTKSMTNLVSGTDYSLKFGVDFVQMLSVAKYSYKVISGTVDLT